MKCDKTNEITSYLKGEVAGPEREALRLHFEGCASCSAELGRFDRVLKALGKLEGIDPSPNFKWRVREAFLRAHPEFLEHPHPAAGTWGDFLRAPFGFVPAWAISIAAHVLLIALAAILIFVPKSPEEEMDEAAIGAKPRLPAGGGPVFDGTPGVGRPSRPEKIGGVAPAVPEEEYTGTGARPAPGTIVPAPHPRRTPNVEKLDLSKWRERVPRERRLLAFFEKRGDQEMREAYGGKGTEKAIRDGLDWLARAQLADGRWTGPTVRAEGTGEFTYSTGLTGLALLAFLAEGHTGRTGPYASNVRRGLEYLLSQQRASGLVGTDRGNYMYDHAIAALALLEASMMTRDEALSTAASAAVNFTVAAQNETGGWGYTSRSPSNDTSVGGWQILLLRLAKLGGNHGVITSLIQAYDRVTLQTDAEGRVGYRARGEYPNGHRALTAVGMLSHQMATHTPDAEVLARQAAVLLEQNPVAGADPSLFMTNDLYFGYFGSLALHQYGGDAWTRWFGPLRDRLLKAQQAEGSWPADFDRWHSYGGQVYTTAMALLVLETPVRYPRLAE